MDAKNQVKVLHELLAEVNDRTAEIEAKLADLHAERRGLELALVRLAGTAECDGSTTQPQRIASEPVVIPHQSPEFIPREEEWKWRMLGKTEAVKRVLAEATKPLGPADIVKTLDSVGLPQEDSESVRGALAYLKRKGKAIFIGRSQWVLVDGAVHRRFQREGQADLIYVDLAESGAAPVAPTSTPARPSADPPEATPRHPDALPTAREAIVGVLRAEGRTMSMSEIVARAPEFGATAQPDTIRSLLTKLFQSGVLERPSHGQYRLATSDCGDPEGESSTESTAGSPPDDEVSDPVPDQGVLGWGNPPGAQRGVRTPSVA